MLRPRENLGPEARWTTDHTENPRKWPGRGHVMEPMDTALHGAVDPGDPQPTKVLYKQ